MGEKHNWEYDYDYKELNDSIRKRPGMFFGSVGVSGVHNAILSLVEFLIENRKKEIFLTLNGPDITIAYIDEQPLNNFWVDAVKAASETFTDENNQYKFRLDHDIFDNIRPNTDALFDSLRELAFLNKDLHITLNGHAFHYGNGLLDLYDYLQTKSGVYWHSKHEPFSFHAKHGDLEIDVTFAAISSPFDPCIFSYVNNHRTEEDGDHVDGFMKSLKSVLNNYRQYSCEHFRIWKDFDIGLIVHARTPHPIYGGSTKRKFINPDVHQMITSVSKENLNRIFNENPEIAKEFVRCWRCSK